MRRSSVLPHTVLVANPTRAANADAGDCFAVRPTTYGRLSCLPTVINIGVQKAGTGELQTWLGAHPHAIAHGGEVHFFDKLKREPSCDSKHSRGSLRLRYARFLWKRRTLHRDELSRGKKSML